MADRTTIAGLMCAASTKALSSGGRRIGMPLRRREYPSAGAAGVPEAQGLVGERGGTPLLSGC
jgi:hypothetical protein